MCVDGHTNSRYFYIHTKMNRQRKVMTEWLTASFRGERKEKKVELQSQRRQVPSITAAPTFYTSSHVCECMCIITTQSESSLTNTACSYLAKPDDFCIHCFTQRWPLGFRLLLLGLGFLIFQSLPCKQAEPRRRQGHLCV